MLYNQKACKDYILTRVKERRPHHEYTRVASDVFPWLENEMRKAIDKMLDQQPSVGKTISME